MNHIGIVIKEFRGKQGMSRKELAEDICTEKYVYLIERGDRTPSTDLARAISDKLGVDLFEYYQYLDCKDPVAVCKTIKVFNEYRRTMNFESMKKSTNEALTISDFHKTPWSYEIEVNRVFSMVFVEENYKEAILKIGIILSRIEPMHSEGEYVVNLYVMLSTAYQAIGDLENAEKAVLSAYEIVRKKSKDQRYKQITTTVNLNMMTLYYFSYEYERAIEVGLRQNQFQMEADTYERAHFTYFYLAYAYYKKGLEEEAIKWFKKGMYLIITADKPMDAYYISNFDLFEVLIQDDRISAELGLAFQDKYGASNLGFAQ